MKRTLGILVFAFVLSGTTLAQPSGPEYQRAAIFHGNRVQSVFGNWGVIGQPAPYGSRGAWIYPTNGYIGDLSILVGLELPLRDYNGDGLPDTVHSVITCPVNRPTVLTDTDPATGQFWTFQPETGYFNAAGQSPAIRSQRASWPDVWPDHPEWGAGKWNGLRGADSLLGDDEAFFRMDDRNDQRFNFAKNNSRQIVFHPDSTDPARAGQGITVGVRYIASASRLFQDVLFRVYDIANTGTTDYSRVVFGTLTGTYIGITSVEDFQEYNNDAAAYFPSEDFILSWNFPGNAMADPFWQGPVGMFGETFVETPAGTHIASCDDFSPSGQVSLGDDQDLWLRMQPGSYVHPANVINDTVVTSGADMDYFYGSGYFSLRAGETKRVVAVVAYGYQKEEIEQKILLAKMLWNSGFNVNAVLNSVSITNFSTHRFLSGPQTIQWTTNVSGGTVSIWYSSDAGAHWSPILTGIPNTGSATWNTQNSPDAAFGLLRIFASDTAGRPYGFCETGSFLTVDNPGNGAPFVRILDSTLSGGSPFVGATIDLPLLIGDPEWGSLSVTFLYRTGAGEAYAPCDSYVAPSSVSVQSHTVSLADLPNSSGFQFKVVVSDGLASSSDTTVAFDKETVRGIFPTNRVQFSGLAQVPVNVFIRDSSQLRADTYVITFSDTAFGGPKTFSVRDSTRHSWVLNGMTVSPGVESAPFDGLTLLAPDITTTPDPKRTRWNREIPGVSRSLTVGVTSVHDPSVSYDGYRQPYDYRIVFENTIVDTSASFAPFEIFGVQPVPVNFRVYNMKTNEKVKVAFWGTLGEKELFFLENVSGSERATWSVDMTFNPADSSAHAGDTVYVFTQKGLSVHDTLTVFGMTTSVPARGGTPGTYALYQNYPNPFNPSTRIDYQLAWSAFVTLSIYDLLGQEVARIVNEVQSPGRHSVLWRGQTSQGQSVASGVYFYRVEARGTSGRGSNFTQTMKMIYLR